MKFGSLKVGAGWIGRTTRAADKTDSDLYYLGASYPISAALTLDAEIARLKVSTGSRATTSIARATYALSKRTAVYGITGYMDNNAQSNLSVSGGQTLTGLPNGLKQLGFMVGMRHLF
jgi:predicted porin